VAALTQRRNAVLTRPVKIALVGLFLSVPWALTPSTSSAQVAVSISVAPPPLPVYEQPPLPAPGWIWAPGYWAWGPEGYFWVPGTWVEAPQPGLLWTPGYWGWSDGLYVWNPGYWGPVVGFYGGVNYGFGYVGHGYEGGYWRGGDFFYNRSVTNVTNVNVVNVYNKTVINNVTENRVSYVGGPGGIVAKPTAGEEQAAQGRHLPATAVQTQQREAAATHHELLASVNHGKPEIAATARPNEFSGHAVAASRAGGPMQPVHARDLTPAKPSKPTVERAPAAAAQEHEDSRKQADLEAKQAQEREALAQQQEKEHAAYAQQQTHDQQAFATMERQHQQQTMQMQQRHAQEAQRAPRPPESHPAAPHEEHR
jgi:WXXGXW repeat (2 copies)